MTSKISFFKLACDERKKLSWMTALMGLVFGLLIPFRVLIVMAMEGREHNTAEAAERVEQLAKIFRAQLGFGHIENMVFILIAGVLCALCTFGYVHSSVKLDFYHSLAVKRENLFGAKLLGSVMTFVLPYLFCQALGVLAGIPYGVVSGGVALEVLAASGQGILFFLASYSGTLLAVMLTGKLLTTVFAVGVFGAYIPMIYLLCIAFREIFMSTALETVTEEAVTQILGYSSPWAFCFYQFFDRGNAVKKGLTGVWPDFSRTCMLAAMVIILLLLSVFLYQHRKTERAGSALAIRHTEGIIKFLLVIPTALFAGLAAYGIFVNMVWVIVFIVLFGTLGCMIMEFIYRWDIRQVFCHKGQIVLSVLTAALIFCGFRYDVAAYNTYLPEKEELAGMAVIERYREYGSYLIDGKMTGNEKEILDYLETDQLDTMYQIAENGVERERGTDGMNRVYGDGCFVDVKYHLKNGKEIYRGYYVENSLWMECLEKLMQDPEFTEKYYPLLKWSKEMSIDTADIAITQMDLSQLQEVMKAAEKEEKTESVRAESSEQNNIAASEAQDVEKRIKLRQDPAEPGTQSVPEKITLREEEPESGAGRAGEKMESESDMERTAEGTGTESEMGRMMEETKAELETVSAGENDTEEQPQDTEPDAQEEEWAEEYSNMVSLTFSGEEVQELLAAYCKDLAEVSIRDMKQATGYIRFEVRNNHSTSDTYGWYPVGIRFAHTMDVFMEKYTEIYSISDETASGELPQN